jgi:hypothetical protein
LLSVDQPFYVYAIVSLDAQTLPAIEDKLACYRAALGKSNPTEFHFTKQKTSARGRKIVAEIGKLLASDPSVRVHLCLVEKEFEVATRIVETYFDPVMDRRSYNARSVTPASLRAG